MKMKESNFNYQVILKFY